MRLAFATSGSPDKSKSVISERMVNLFAQVEASGAKAKVTIRPTPGLRQFALLPDTGIRGIAELRGYHVVVAGPRVYRVDPQGVPFLLGAISAGGPVSMASNGRQLVIVVPETLQAWVATTAALTQITDPDFPGAVAVTSIDAYHIFAQAESGRFFTSALGDAEAYDALDYATAESSPDDLVTVQRVGTDLWCVGERSIEIYSNTGAADFPFQRYSGGIVARGCAARESFAVIGKVALWVGDNLSVYQAEGNTPTRISTHQIEQALAGYARVDDAIGLLYEQEGHTFYCLSFPTAGATWVFDISTGAWHERESQGYGTWRCHTAASVGGVTILGDALDGRLYTIDPRSATEDGETILRSVTGTTLHADGKRVFYSMCELEMETGVGLNTGQGVDPQIWLEWSDDGGHTWSDPYPQSLGRMGAYRHRVVWNRLGMARSRVYRVSWSDPVFTALIASNHELTPGAA